MRTSNDKSRRGLNGRMIRLAGAALMFVTGIAHAGYDAHITRRANWVSHKGPRISIAQWRAYVRTDREIKRDSQNTENDFLIELPGEEVIMVYDPGLGELRVKDPSPQALAKLTEIARALHARVQGDDGEFYPPDPPK